MAPISSHWDTPGCGSRNVSPSYGNCGKVGSTSRQATYVSGLKVWYRGPGRLAAYFPLPDGFGPDVISVPVSASAAGVPPLRDAAEVAGALPSVPLRPACAPADPHRASRALGQGPGGTQSSDHGRPLCSRLAWLGGTAGPATGRGPRGRQPRRPVAGGRPTHGSPMCVSLWSRPRGEARSRRDGSGPRGPSCTRGRRRGILSGLGECARVGAWALAPGGRGGQDYAGTDLSVLLLGRQEDKGYKIRPQEDQGNADKKESIDSWIKV